MRRYRRMVVIDRLIPFFAAGVGLVALAGAVVVQMNAESRSHAVLDELGKVQASIEALGKRTDALAAADNDGTAAGLLALQGRMEKLEADWTAQQAAAAAAPAPAAVASAVPIAPAVAAGDAQSASTAIDPNLPTTDCIPVGTRFMVTPNQSYPLCQTKAELKVGAIDADTVEIDGAGVIAETGFGTLVGTKCTVMVFSADAAGFAEVRVACL